MKKVMPFLAGAVSGAVIGIGLAAPNGDIRNLAAACVCAAWVFVLVKALRPI
jgi:phosphate/sulfate permease